jgi:hypothetical protein
VPRSSQVLFHSGFVTKTMLFPHSCYMPHRSHSPCLDRCNNIFLRVQTMKFNVLFSPVTSYPLVLNVFLSLLFFLTWQTKFDIHI